MIHKLLYFFEQQLQVLLRESLGVTFFKTLHFYNIGLLVSELVDHSCYPITLGYMLTLSNQIDIKSIMPVISIQGVITFITPAL